MLLYAKCQFSAAHSCRSVSVRRGPKDRFCCVVRHSRAGCPCFGVYGKCQLLSKTTCIRLTQDSNQYLSVLAKPVTSYRKPKAFLKKKDGNPLLGYRCILIYLPSAQSHHVRIHAGFSCLDYIAPNPSLLLIQALNDQGRSRHKNQGDRHLQTPALHAVGGGRWVAVNCWGRSFPWSNHWGRATSKLIVGALCSPPRAPSLPDSSSFEVWGRTDRPQRPRRSPPAPLCSAP